MTEEEREMLELAAKAAGIEIFGGLHEHADGVLLFSGSIWNPLTDDGDALRLAVAVGRRHQTGARVCIEFQSGGEPDFTVVEMPGETVQYHNDDPMAATRRAIVRAAAEIGRAM